MDEVVRIIRGSASPAEARAALLDRDWPVAEIASYIKLVEAVETELSGDVYNLSEIQVRAILELRLHRLTALGRDEIGKELAGLAENIAEYLAILGDRVKLYAVMREELEAIEREFATPRLCQITASWDGLDDEDLMEREEMVVTVTHGGYIKRTPLATFRAQNRGGKGRAGMATKEEDVVIEMFVTSTHTPVLFFSDLGRVYRMKVWKLPEGGPQTKGRPMINLLPLAEGESITNILSLPEDENEWASLNIVFATAQGMVRRNSMDAFTNVPSNGKMAMGFVEGKNDRLIGVRLLNEEDDILLASRAGKAIRFAAKDARETKSRTGIGVRGMTLKGDDEVISLSVLGMVSATTEEREDYLRYAPWKAEKEGEPNMSPDRFTYLDENEQYILTVCANGYGKMSSAYEYRQIGRGGQGVTNIDNISRNGAVVASFPATKGDQLMLVTNQAKLIRTPLSSMRVIGRGSSGVRLFNVEKNEFVVSAARIPESDDDEAADSIDGVADDQINPASDNVQDGNAQNDGVQNDGVQDDGSSSPE
jgi:DNA gyrase subunit A